MTLKWGILGLGNIAHQFCQDLALLKDHELIAVASRTLEKAQEFGNQYDARNCHGNYDDLFQDKEVDIIYIATPHNSHKKYSISAMKAGKHVLCEKPLAVNKQEVKEMVQVAKDEKVFLMEAFWSRFNPSINDGLDLIKKGKIGEVNYLQADFCFYTDAPDESRVWNMQLAGGALLDIGIYPLFLSYILFGMPEQILASSTFHHTGADRQTAVILKYDQAIATLMSGFVSQSDMRAKIYGSHGAIFIEAPWHQAQAYTLWKEGNYEHFERPTFGKGYTYEIEICRRCIEKGLKQSAQWSHHHSLDLVTIMDEIRKQVGLKYPFE